MTMLLSLKLIVFNERQVNAFHSRNKNEKRNIEHRSNEIPNNR